MYFFLWAVVEEINPFFHSNIENEPFQVRFFIYTGGNVRLSTSNIVNARAAPSAVQVVGYQPDRPVCPGILSGNDRSLVIETHLRIAQPRDP